MPRRRPGQRVVLSDEPVAVGLSGAGVMSAVSFI